MSFNNLERCKPPFLQTTKKHLNLWTFRRTPFTQSCEITPGLWRSTPGKSILPLSQQLFKVNYAKNWKQLFHETKQQSRDQHSNLCITFSVALLYFIHTLSCPKIKSSSSSSSSSLSSSSSPLSSITSLRGKLYLNRMTGLSQQLLQLAATFKQEKAFFSILAISAAQIRVLHKSHFVIPIDFHKQRWWSTICDW